MENDQNKSKLEKSIMSIVQEYWDMLRDAQTLLMEYDYEGALKLFEKIAETYPQQMIPPLFCVICKCYNVVNDENIKQEDRVSKQKEIMIPLLKEIISNLENSNL